MSPKRSTRIAQLDLGSLWTESIDWSDLTLETTLPPGSAARRGRIVPSDRAGDLNGRRVHVGELLTVAQALELQVIGPAEEAYWRLQLHNQRARTIVRRVQIDPGDAKRRDVERRLAAGRPA